MEKKWFLIDVHGKHPESGIKYSFSRVDTFFESEDTIKDKVKVFKQGSVPERVMIYELKPSGEKAYREDIK